MRSGPHVLVPNRMLFFSLLVSGLNLTEILNSMRSLCVDILVDIVGIHLAGNHLFVIVQRTPENVQVECEDVVRWFTTTLTEHGIVFAQAPHLTLPLTAEYRVVSLIFPSP